MRTFSCIIDPEGSSFLQGKDKVEKKTVARVCSRGGATKHVLSRREDRRSERKRKGRGWVGKNRLFIDVGDFVERRIKGLWLGFENEGKLA